MGRNAFSATHGRDRDLPPGFATSSNGPTSEASEWTSSKTTRTDSGPSTSISRQATGIPDWNPHFTSRSPQVFGTTDLLPGERQPASIANVGRGVRSIVVE